MDLIKRSFFSGAGGGPSFFRPLYHKRLSSFEVFSPRRERYKKSFSQTRGKPIDATSARRSRRRLRARRKTRFLRMRSFFRRRHRDLLRSSRFCSRYIEKIARNEWAFYNEGRTIVGSAHREGSGFAFVCLRRGGRVERSSARKRRRL